RQAESVIAVDTQSDQAGGQCDVSQYLHRRVGSFQVGGPHNPRHLNVGCEAAEAESTHRWSSKISTVVDGGRLGVSKSAANRIGYGRVRVGLASRVCHHA